MPCLHSIHHRFTDHDVMEPEPGRIIQQMMIDEILLILLDRHTQRIPYIRPRPRYTRSLIVIPIIPGRPKQPHHTSPVPVSGYRLQVARPPHPTHQPLSTNPRELFFAEQGPMPINRLWLPPASQPPGTLEAALHRYHYLLPQGAPQNRRRVEHGHDPHIRPLAFIQRPSAHRYLTKPHHCCQGFIPACHHYPPSAPRHPRLCLFTQQLMPGKQLFGRLLPLALAGIKGRRKVEGAPTYNIAQT